jgi:hypothetical protein
MAKGQYIEKLFGYARAYAASSDACVAGSLCCGAAGGAALGPGTPSWFFMAPSRLLAARVLYDDGPAIPADVDLLSSDGTPGADFRI